MNFGFKGINLITSAINGRNFKFPVTPYQTTCGQYDDDKGDCSDCSESNQQRCRCIHVEEVMQAKMFDKDRPETQIMVFSAVGEEGRREFAHPVHLHGHSFHVIYVGYGKYNETNALVGTSTDIGCGKDALCKKPKWHNGEVPDRVSQEILNINTHILKDTVIVPAGGYVVVAFSADNPGYWFLHCHIEVHQLEGMGVLIEEYSSVQHKGPPEGINNIGNFRWEINDYKTFVKDDKKCKLQEGSNKEKYYIAAIVILSVLAVFQFISNVLTCIAIVVLYEHWKLSKYKMDDLTISLQLGCFIFSNSRQLQNSYFSLYFLQRMLMTGF